MTDVPVLTVTAVMSAFLGSAPTLQEIGNHLAIHATKAVVGARCIVPW